jgi:hypothetical protein
MPTSDPIRRRRQNCQNQKRWRERQTNQLQSLSASLEEKAREVEQLQKNSQKLETDLRKTLREIAELKNENATLRNATLRASHVSPRKDLSCVTGTSVEQSRMMYGYKDSLTKVNTASSVTVSDTTAKQHDEAVSICSSGSTASTTSPQDTGHCFLPKQESLALGFDPAFISEAPASGDESPKAALHKLLQRRTMGQTQTASPVTSLESVLPTNANLALVTTNPKAFQLLQEDLEETHENLSSEPLSSFVDCSIGWMLRNNFGVGKNMTTFPYPTRLSKHIQAVQTVLRRSLSLLKSRPQRVRNRVVETAFTWMIRQAWPSAESCFKMMVGSVPILVRFEY